MNSNLLTLVQYATKHTPLMMDGVPASEDPEAGPFLITSSKSLMWVGHAFRGGFLRVAVQRIKIPDLFRSIVENIAEEGVKRAWGNVLPPTKEGVLEGLAHLNYYGLPDPVLLYGSEFDVGVAPGVNHVPADWLPSTWGVLVPDREYVGTAYLFKEGQVGAVVHNPSRGVVVIR